MSSRVTTHPATPGNDAAAPARAPMVIVLMGVAGSGKTTIGRKLAAELGWPFRDADEFHSTANIAKMASGTPLTDDDRRPWLAAIRAGIEEQLARQESAVFTCSALRESYRQILTADQPEVKLVQLAGDYRLIQDRLEKRSGHFMAPAMLASQFALLETPRHALTLDIAQSPEAIVARIRTAFSL